MTVPTTEKADRPKPDAVTSSSSCGEATCHILPCNVDFEGMAKTHMFFKPIQVEDGIFASSFRGRGLLATQEEKTDDNSTWNHPHLLSLEENRIQVKASISNVMEWHHDYNIQSIKYKENHSSRVQEGKEWIEIAEAVSIAIESFHIPIQEQMQYILTVQVASIRRRSVSHRNLTCFPTCFVNCASGNTTCTVLALQLHDPLPFEE